MIQNAATSNQITQQERRREEIAETQWIWWDSWSGDTTQTHTLSEWYTSYVCTALNPSPRVFIVRLLTTHSWTPPRRASASLTLPLRLPDSSPVMNTAVPPPARPPSFTHCSCLCRWVGVKRPTHSGVPPNWEESKWSVIGRPSSLLSSFYLLCHSLARSLSNPRCSASDWTLYLPEKQTHDN